MFRVSLQRLSERFFMPKKELSEIWSKMYIGLHVKYPLFLSDFNETWICSTDLKKKNVQIPSFMKIRPMGTELFHADGRRDMTKLIVAFRNSANAPKNNWQFRA
jgi:hypothetical protein